MLTGTIIAQEGNLVGVLMPSGLLSGSIRPAVKLTGKVAISVDHEYYVGEYNVTPKIEQQILTTNDKLMADDITVKAIPFYEVSNPQGGTTFIIGGD